MSQPLTFQQAIAQSAEWIRLWDAEELSDDVLADDVGKLVGERDGARGFFVASLTSDSPLMDRLPEALVVQLRLAGAEVVDLTARNLAMSTAMIVHHRRNQDDELMEGSMRVQSRSLDLIRQLDPQLVKERLGKLLLGLQLEGEDQSFFERWGYDTEQRDAIKTTLLAVAT
ncbi:MAG: hypothetical protein ACK41W_02615 [Cyanobacteriota bacterium]|jgi:hypothetical protein